MTQYETGTPTDLNKSLFSDEAWPILRKIVQVTQVGV